MPFQKRIAFITVVADFILHKDKKIKMKINKNSWKVKKKMKNEKEISL